MRVGVVALDTATHMRKELLALWLALPGHALISPPPLVLRTSAQACRSAVARMYDDDDSWVSNRGLLSAASLDVLFKFGPVVYGARCFDSDEYDESVRKFMRENRGVSRKLAEQVCLAFKPLPLPLALAVARRCRKHQLPHASAAARISRRAS